MTVQFGTNAQIKNTQELKRKPFKFAPGFIMPDKKNFPRVLVLTTANNPADSFHKNILNGGLLEEINGDGLMTGDHSFDVGLLGSLLNHLMNANPEQLRQFKENPMAYLRNTFYFSTQKTDAIKADKKEANPFALAA